MRRMGWSVGTARRVSVVTGAILAALVGATSPALAARNIVGGSSGACQSEMWPRGVHGWHRQRPFAAERPLTNGRQVANIGATPGVLHGATEAAPKAGMSAGSSAGSSDVGH